ncbi:MAG: carbohydrate kinase, partial [Spirochaetales bacterium]|nr:carbohydrate kinase [Spirochaetales bacterium]
MARYALGFDVGSSSIKASLVDIDTGKRVASAGAPATEMPISAPRSDWAEQDPAMWWRYMVEAASMLARDVDLAAVVSVGISYQMHGLVAVNRAGEPLRPAIIWCDSRAVPYGEAAFRALGGASKVLPRLLNSPGNFTAAKLAWVKEHEPALYADIWKIMLPGDYLAFRMTGEPITTASGLSEGIFWDFDADAPAQFLLDHFGFDAEVLPEAKESFGDHGRVTKAAAAELGIPAGTPVAYRAGDQPNNALSLNVLNPGEVAATAGTSGVIYGVVDRPVWDEKSRVNAFLHVNHRADQRRYGVLQVLNGTGILNRWIRENALDPLPPVDCIVELTEDFFRVPYERLNDLADLAPVGSDGLVFLPFGNGAERILENGNYGASLHGLNFNLHDRRHLVRAAQEGIVFALGYGLEIMRDIGMSIDTVRAGHANMFLSPLFRRAFATVSGAVVELYNTDGSEGAARGGAYGAGLYGSLADAFAGLDLRETIEPDASVETEYR